MNQNPQAIRLANERFRVFADRAGQLYHFGRALQAQIVAERVESLFSGDAKSVLQDRSAEDGRTPLTNDDIKGLIGAVDAVVAFYDNDPALRDLLLRAAVNPERL